MTKDCTDPDAEDRLRRTLPSLGGLRTLPAHDETTMHTSARGQEPAKEAGGAPTVRSARRPPETASRSRLTKGRTREVLFVQGGGKGTHDQWDNKLVASLASALGADYTIRYPRMPAEANPRGTAWKKAIARELNQLSDGVMLVGHSIGAAIVLDYLADATAARRPAAVFSIAAPFIGEGGWPSDELRPTRRLAAELHDGPPLYFYQGRADEIVPVSHIDLFAAAFPQATIRRLAGRDHQLNDDLSEVGHDMRLLE